MKSLADHVRALLIVTVALLLLLPACETTEQPHARTNQNFLTTWNAQLDKYRADFIDKDSTIRAEEAKGFPVDLQTVADPWSVIISRVSEVSAMVRSAYVIAGRGEAIKAFITHMQTEPTPGLSEIWFLRQVEEVQAEAREVDAKTEVFLAGFNEKVRMGAEWILEVGKLARAQGMVEGKIAELRSLYPQAVSYYQDLAQAKADAQYRAEQQAQAAQTLMAMGAYLGQLNYQQQLINTLNRPRTCTFLLNTMTCN